MPPGGWEQPIPRPTGLPSGVQLASWGSRVGAAILDALILTLLGALLVAPGVVLLATDNPVLGGILLGVGIIVYIVAVFVYAPAFMQRDGRHNGQSLGKQAVGIRVIRVDREPYGFGAAFVREFVVKNLLFAFVGGFFLSIPTLLDVLWPLWDDENRALHDMVVNSRVVRA